MPIKIMYANRFELPEDISTLCKYCGKQLPIIKKRAGYLNLLACHCQYKKGNLRYMASVLGEDTELFKKTWQKYQETLKKKGPYLDRLIKEHGKEEGLKIFKIFLEKCDVSLPGFIRRHGEEEGTKRYLSFKNKSLITKDTLIAKYGEEKGLSIHNSKITKMKKKSHFTLSYWLDFFNGDIDTAKEAYKEFQTRDQFYFIAKYGEELGEIKYKNLCDIRKKQNSLEYRIEQHGDRGQEIWDKECLSKKVVLNTLIEKHGEIEGTILYRKLTKAKALTLENFISRLGENEGFEKFKQYKILLKNHLSRISVRSSFSTGFIKELIEYLPEDIIQELMYDDNELGILNSLNSKWYFYDLCYTKDKKIIEINGDFWHANPTIYNKDFIHPLKKISASAIWEEDREKIKIAENYGYKIIVIWEKDIRYERKPIIEHCVNFLKG